MMRWLLAPSMARLVLGTGQTTEGPGLCADYIDRWVLCVRSLSFFDVLRGWGVAASSPNVTYLDVVLRFCFWVLSFK